MSTRYIDLVATVVLGILQLIVSFALSGLGWLQLMSVASCSERACDDGLLGLSGYLTAIVAVLALIGSVAGVVARALHRRTSWWVPAVGVAVVILAYVAATTLNQVSRA
ncbi:MAG: hypothetical protein AAGC66_16470 [Leifsonia sp.]